MPKSLLQQTNFFHWDPRLCDSSLLGRQEYQQYQLNLSESGHTQDTLLWLQKSVDLAYPIAVKSLQDYLSTSKDAYPITKESLIDSFLSACQKLAGLGQLFKAEYYFQRSRSVKSKPIKIEYIKLAATAISAAIKSESTNETQRKIDQFGRSEFTILRHGFETRIQRQINLPTQQQPESLIPYLDKDVYELVVPTPSLKSCATQARR